MPDRQTDWPNDWLTDRQTDWLNEWMNEWPTDWLTDEQTDRQTDRLTDWLTDWLTDRQTGRQTDWLTDWQTDWLTDWLTDRLTDWKTDWLTDWMNKWLADRPTDRPTDWLTDRQTDWLRDRQTDWLTDRLTDWKSDWLRSLFRPSHRIGWENDPQTVVTMDPSPKTILPPFLLIREFEKQNTRGNVSKISVSLACVLLTDRIEIHQLQPLVWSSNLLYVMLSGCNVIGGFPSDLSKTRMQDSRKFWKRFCGCFVFQSPVSTKTVASVVLTRSSEIRDCRELHDKRLTHTTHLELIVKTFSAERYS